MTTPLPIDAHLERIRSLLARHRAVIVVAPPGSGKTTRVPPALAGEGRTIVLQPRRVAARAIARRIADEQAWTVGREVGWHVRFERRFGPETRVLLATEGMLTARLQHDPLGSEFETIVLDEFHERSIHADLGLALARQAWLARDSLRLVVMSATLEAEPVSAFLGDCPIVEVTDLTHALDVTYAPGLAFGDAVRTLSAQTRRGLLCFLPGAPEINRALPDVARRLPGFDVVALHGSLDPGEQERALAPGTRRRIVLATNLAETSLTVPDVDAVVDTGLQKVLRYDAARGIDSLMTERISQASADQRAGRAARIGPGLVLRLWDARDRLRPGREPDVARIDLAATLLDLAAWGGDPATFAWFDPPPRPAIEDGMRLLERLGAVAGRTITALGRRMQAIPVHPRLARTLIEAGGAVEACVACALLAERTFLPPRHEATTCDLLAALDERSSLPPHVQAVARQIEGIAAAALGSARRAHIDEEGLRRALYAGYPDRLARRRDPAGDRLLLASGTGATLSSDSGVVGGELLVALDLHAQASGHPRVRLASRVEPGWVEATSVDIEHWFDAESGRVRAVSRERAGALTLSERRVSPDPARASALLTDAWLARGPRDRDVRLLRRLAFAGISIDLTALVRRACASAPTIDAVEIASVLEGDVVRRLARDAPETLPLPTGREARLEYAEDGSVSVAVPLQELFGLGETPRVGPARTPVILHLLAPNGRPVQMTRDLTSFWTRTYPEVRRELRGRYPRHAWPDDPRSATPSSRGRPRPKR